jgi:putative sigma-54 modulation protein
MQHPIDFVIRAIRADTAEALRAYAVRRLSFALRPFGHRVRHVTVRLNDLNGPKRGVDSRCSMIVDLADGGRIVVEATTAWPFASVTRAAERLSETMRREFERATSHTLRVRTCARRPAWHRS